MDYKRADYIQFMQLYSRQNWLIRKEPNLEELVSICKTNEQKNLLFSLLERFHYLKDDALNVFLNQIADYVTTCGIEIDRTQLVACTYDEEADSGQKVLDMIRSPLFERGWRNFKTVNNVGKATKFVQRDNKTNIVFIDEFVGTGRSLKTRIDWLSKNVDREINIRCCFIAGMKTAIKSLQNEGMEIFCPLQLEKGISEFYRSDELKAAINDMLYLESTLASQINDKKIKDYSFGYGQAEALYSLHNGNTPNSVFPIFWWIKDYNENERKTVLTRYETGFEI